MYDHKPQVNKSLLLTRPGIRENPKLQASTAKIIRGLDYKQAERFVDNVKKGEIKHTGTSFQMRSQPYKPITTSSEAKEVIEQGSFSIDGIETTTELIKLLTGKTKIDKIVVDESRNFRLRSMKRMHEQELTRMINYFEILRKLIDDTIPMLEKEIESQKEKEKLASR